MYKRLIILTLAVFFNLVIFIPVYAVKAYPLPVTVTQPDGTQLTINLHGDEFRHFKTSEDGYLLKANAKGFLTYATVNSSGTIVESDHIAHNASKRSAADMQFLKTVDSASMLQKVQSAPSKSKMLLTQSQPQKVFPLLGTPRSLVILVNFSDVAFVTATPQTAFTNLLNQSGYSANGGTGSARDYFMASSYGKLAPDFDVYGPVTLPQPMAYYGTNDSSGNDQNPVQMVVDACTVAHDAGFDFTPYDTDGDGVIDNVFICYAGYNEAEGGPVNSVWPKSGEVYSGNYSGTTTPITFDGKLLDHYACTSELQGASGGNMCGVGTFCHEFGHVLGLPDYYDTNLIQANTLNSWSIMDYGNYSNEGRTPPTYSVYDRFFLGWLTPEQEAAQTNLTLLPISQSTAIPANTTNQAFLLSATTHNLQGQNPSPSEFFMLEYRKLTGWDAYLPAEGLCIWHIDYNQSLWTSNDLNYYSGTTQTEASHMHVYLQPLVGSTTTPGTAFTSGSFIPLIWASADINRAISNITKTADNITFNLMFPRIATTGSITSFSTTFGAPTASQDITLSALDLNGNLNVGFTNSVNFEVKLSTDVTWSKSLSLVPVSGIVNATVNVRYNPTSTGSQTDQLSFTSAELTTSSFSLSGTNVIGPNSPLIFVGIVDNSLLFYPTLLNTTNTKTINIKTTDIVSDLSLAVTGMDATMFTASVSSIAKDAANATAGNNITINYIPTTLGVHSATLTISGGGLPDKVISLTGTGK